MMIRSRSFWSSYVSLDNSICHIFVSERISVSIVSEASIQFILFLNCNVPSLCLDFSSLVSFEWELGISVLNRIFIESIPVLSVDLVYLEC